MKVDSNVDSDMNTIASRAKEAGVTKVAFDRSGYKYHGCVAALANAARSGGIKF